MPFSKKLILFSILFLTMNFIFADDQNLSAVSYFKLVRSKNLELLPPKFAGDLTSKSIEKKLLSIPRDSYLDASKKIVTRVNYSKKSGVILTVENVDEIYRDLYRDLPRRIFAFDLLLSSEYNNTFNKKYNISYYSTNQENIILKLALKSAENSLLLFVNRADDRITRMDYRLGKQVLSITEIEYNDFGGDSKKYKIPFRFKNKIIQDSGNYEPDVFEIQNIQLF